MRTRWHHGLIGELRREMALFARVCLLILAVPLLHPLAEAKAAQAGAGEIICSQFGHSRERVSAQEHLPIGAADDCPCGIACPMQGFAAQPAVSTVLAAILLPERLVRVGAERGRDRPPDSVEPWTRPPGRAPPLSA